MNYKFTELQLAGNKQVTDARALLDLLNEKTRSQVIMSFSKAKRGRANLKHNRFTVPKHAFDKGETYLFYYVIHEFTHCMGYPNHGKDFKSKEQSFLNLFGIKIDYAKAYPRDLYANGEISYSK